MSDLSLPQKILIIDSDQSVGQAIKAPLEKNKIDVDTATDLGTALYLFNQNIYPVVMIDANFDALPGLILVQRWRAHDVLEKRNTAFIMMVGNRNARETAQLNLIEELDDLGQISKPVNPIQLLPILIKSMLTHSRLVRYAEVSRHAAELGMHKETVLEAVEYVKSNLSELGPKGSALLLDVYELNQKWDKAMELIDSHLQKHPDNLQTINHKGRLLLKLGRPAEALRCMENADKIAPNNIQRLNNMALAYLEVSMPDQSVNKMKELIKFNPDNEDFKFDMFARLHEAGFDEHAISLCKETSNPLDVVRHYNNKGVALARAGDVESAIREYQLSLRFYPKFKENYRIFYNLALAHGSLKTLSHLEEALAYLDDCLELNDQFEKALKARENIGEQLKKLQGRN